MGAVVYDDHRFSAGRLLDVELMPSPHTHSQIEINLVLQGHMVYRFEGRLIRVEAGQLVVFWGTIPHQTVQMGPVTRFVCLYVPVSMFLAIQIGDALRGALFGGALIAAERLLPAEQDTFLRWREDLLGGDGRRERIVRDELSARLRRMDLDGWTALGQTGRPSRPAGPLQERRLEKVEAMARVIAERAGEPIGVAEVARAVGLNPNYAMTLFKTALGITINQYLTRQRLDTAQALLLSTDRDVADIAFEAGFGSLSRFYQAFSAKMGASPARFRRNCRHPS